MGLISNISRGRFGLKLTFWGFWVLGGVAAWVLIQLIGLTMDWWDAFPLVGPVLMGYSAYQVPVLIGIVRASREYPGPRRWVILARIAVGLGILWCCSNLIGGLWMLLVWWDVIPLWS